MGAVALPFAFALASGPSTNMALNYQARLTDSNGVAVADGAKNVKFTVWDALSGGNCKWSARGTCGTPTAKSVTVASGSFSTVLGEAADVAMPSNLFSADESRYLEISVETSTPGSYETLSPRKRIVSGAYAMNANLLDDLDTSAVGGTAAFVPVTDSSGNFTLTKNVTFDTNTFFVDATNHRVGIGTTSPSANFNVASTAGSTAKVLYAGPPATSFESWVKQYWMDNSLNTIGALNSSTATIYDALSVVNQDNTTNRTVGATASAFGTHTSGTKPTVGGLSAYAYNEYGGSVTNMYGLTGFTENDGAGSIGSMKSIFLYNENTAGGNVTNQYGIHSQIYNSGAGAITNQYGAYFESGIFGSSGTIGSLYGVYVANPLNSGTITSNYGIYLANQTGATTNYAIYSAGGQSYHAGNFGIGDTSPASLLTVGSGDLFQVDSSGDMVKIKNVTYSWPSSQAGGSNYLLTNNGSGTLSWSSLGSIAGSTYFVQNGNSFTANAVLGTNDNYTLSFETNGTTRLTLGTDGHLLPAADDTYDLGGASNRFRDLYLGAGSLHVGTSATDEGVVSYDTSGNILNIGTDSTTNADVAFFTDDLYLDKSTGRVGINTASPSARLHIVSADDTGIPAIFESKDADGVEATLEIANTGGTYGVPFIDFREDSNVVGLLLGHDVREYGLVNGITLSSTSGRDIGFRINGTTEVARFTTGGIFTMGSALTAQKMLLYESGNWRSGFGIQANDFRIFTDDGTSVMRFGHISTSDGTTFTEYMRMDENGRFGVNDASPDNTLDVTGSFSAGTSDQFVISSAGIISSAAGITSSGTVTFSGLSAGGIVKAGSGTGTLSVGAVSLTSEVSGTLPVANGGTNSSSALNNNRIMVSSSGAIVEAAALTNGQLLIGSTGAAPVAAALTQGSGITVTNGAGSITVATASGVDTTASDDFVQGGNSFGALATLGTNDNYSLSFETNGTTRLTMGTDGHLLPAADDTYDLGGASNRFRDLYLGAGSLHVGTSASAEGIIFYTDTTQDVLNIGTDATGGADIAFFTDDLYLDKSTGYVGIGTTTPAKMLGITGDIAIAPSSKIGSGNGWGDDGAASYSTLELYNGATGNTVLNNQGYQIRLQTAGSDRLTILNGGNVGIGTTSPSQKLDVAGNIAITANGGLTAHAGNLMTPFGGIGTYQNLWLQSENFDTSWTSGKFGNWVKPTITNNDTAAPNGETTAAKIARSHANASMEGAIISATADTTYTGSVWLKAGTETTAVLCITTGNSGSMVGDCVGSLAISLTSNWQRYSVNATVPSSGVNQVEFGIGFNSGTIGDYYYAWGAQIEVGSSPSVYAKTSGSTVSSGDGLVLDSAGRHLFLNGNVGIGTASPSSILHVSGGQARLPNGSVIAGNNPGIAFDSYSDTGFGANTENIGIWESGVLALNLTNTLKEFRVPSDYKFAFSAATNNNSASDTSLYRNSAGVLRTDGSLVVGGNVGIGDTSPAALLTVGSGDKFQVDSNGRAKLVGSTQTDGTFILSFANGDGLNTSSAAYGIVGEANNSGSGILYGMLVSAGSNYAGAVISLYGIKGAVRTLNASTAVASSYALYAGSPTITAGSITASYGLYVQGQEVSGVTTGYGIYQAGSGDDNYFAGNVGIGTASPAQKLHIDGTASGSYGTAVVRLDSGDSGGAWNSALVKYVKNATQDQFEFNLGGAGTSQLTVQNAGNVGIGDTTPASLLTVGNGDLFQVNSSGAIAAATGITSSGTITFSGLSAGGIVKATVGTGVLSVGSVALSSEVTGTLPIANGGTNATSFTSNKYIYYNGTSFASDTNGPGDFLSSSTTLFTLDADSGTTQDVVAGDTVTFAGGAGITTLVGSTNQITITNSGDTTSDTIADDGAIALASEVSGTLPVGNGGTGTTTQFTLGSVVFAGGSGVYSQDNANFFWDDTNNRLGIGTNLPADELQVSGDARVTRLGINASPTDQLMIYDNTTASMTMQAGVNAPLWITAASDGFSLIDGGGPVTKIKIFNQANSGYIYMNGDVGIGDTTPAAMLTVGSGDKFQVSSAGNVTLNGSYMFMNSGVGSGVHGITWYSPAYNAWIDYMAPPGAGKGPLAAVTAPSGSLVNSWAKRSYIENIGGYGWTFESAANTTTPAVVFEIRASDGTAHTYGGMTVDQTTALNGAAAIGDGGDDIAINSNDWDINSSGTITGATWNGTAVGVGYGGTGTSTALTQGSVVFAGASGVYSQDNANFFWDDTNNRLGIGTASPAVGLDIYQTAQAQFYLRDDSGGFKFVTQAGTNYIESASAGMSGAAPLRFTDMNAGNTWMIINSNGNVGIGTASPGAVLSVFDSNNSRAYQMNFGYSSTETHRLGRNNTTGLLEFDAITNNNGFKFKSTAGTPGSFVVTDMNVGIGTTSPSGKLHVVGSQDYLNTNFILTADATTDGIWRFSPQGDGAGGYITFNGAVTANTNGTLVSGSSTITGDHATRKVGAFQYGGGTTGTSGFTFLTADAGTDAVLYERMRIQHDGNVGIGIVSPLNYRLNVVTGGTSGILLNTANSTVGSPAIDFYDTARTVEAVMTTTDGTTNGVFIASYSSHPLMLGTAMTTKMTILTDGKVGIGTTGPGAQLQVNSAAAGTIGTIVKGAASQTANLQQWQNSAGSVLTYIDASGNFVHGNFTLGTDNITMSGYPTYFQWGNGQKLEDNAVGGLRMTSAYALMIDADDNSDGSNGVAGNSYIRFSTRGSSRLFIDNDGEIGIGDDSPAALLTVGSGDLFQVGSDGDLDKVKNVAYSWPSSQGSADTYLKNDGSGNLSWAAGGGGGVSGSGTSGYVPRWTGSSTLGNSAIQDDGTYTAINTGPTSSHRLFVTTSSGTSAILGQYLGAGYGLYGTSNSTSAAIYGLNSSSAAGVYGENNMSGDGIYGKAYAGRAAAFYQAGILSTGNTSPTVYIRREWDLNGQSATGALLEINDGTASTGDLLKVAKGGSVKLAVDSDGNLGVGASTPNYRLEASQSLAEAYSSSALPTPIAYIYNSNAADGNHSSLVFSTEPTSGNGGVTYISSVVTAGGTADMAFGTRNASTYGEKMRIKADGKVGIGDTSPASLLTVGNGDLFQVNSSGQVVAGTWQGSAVGTAYGGTGLTSVGGAGTFLGSNGTVLSYSAVSLTSSVSGVLPIANGGTNASSLTSNQFLYYNGTSIAASGYNWGSFLSSESDTLATVTGRGATTGTRSYFNAGVEGSSSSLNGVVGTSTAGGGYAAGNFTTSTANTYGVWATSSNYVALYASSTSGYALLTASGNVGIGDSSPSALFTVGNGDLFRVSSAGNVIINSSATTGLNLGPSANTYAIRLEGASTYGIYADGPGANYFAGSLQTGGIITAGSLGSATNNTALCRNSSNQIATCSNSFVTNVTASSPLSSSGGTTPNITFSGTLGIANGGTNSSSLTSSQFLWSNGTSVVASGYNQNSFHTGTGASNRVAFFTGSSTLSYSNGFVWDSTNNRLGLNHTSPSQLFSVTNVATIDVNGTLDVSKTATYTGYAANFVGYNNDGIRAGSNYAASSYGSLYVTNSGTNGNAIWVATGRVAGNFPTGLGSNYACLSSASGGYLGQCAASSIRYKRDVVSLELDLEKLLQLEPVRFYYKQDMAPEKYFDEKEGKWMERPAPLHDDRLHVGFIAEWAEPLTPELIIYDNDGIVENFDYPKLTAYHQAMLKDLYSRTILFDQASGTYLALATAEVTAAEPVKSSRSIAFRASAWDAGAGVEVERDISILNEITDKDTYKLSFKNDDGIEVAFLGQSGDLALKGNLYPSDRGAIQTSKYIYYDGSAELGGDMMRTNASGWGTGSYDFAETFPSNDMLEPGDLVMVDTLNEGKVRKADSSQATNGYLLAGIVSTRPGFLAGITDVGHYPVALDGRVPTKVSLESGPIAVGDPITVSSEPGVGMKANPDSYVVGIALQAFGGEVPEGGSGADIRGTVTVYLKIGWYDGSVVSAPDNRASQNEPTGAMTQILDMGGHAIVGIGALEGTGGLWSIDATGKLTIKEVVAEKVTAKEVSAEQMGVRLTDETKTAGQGLIPAGSTGYAVTNPVIKSTSKIFITFKKSPRGAWWVDEVNDGIFVIKLDFAAQEETPFDYWIVQVQDDSTPPAPEIPATPTEPIPEEPDPTEPTPEEPTPTETEPAPEEPTEPAPSDGTPIEPSPSVEPTETPAP